MNLDITEALARDRLGPHNANLDPQDIWRRVRRRSYVRVAGVALPILLCMAAVSTVFARPPAARTLLLPSASQPIVAEATETPVTREVPSTSSSSSAEGSASARVRLLELASAARSALPYPEGKFHYSRVEGRASEQSVGEPAPAPTEFVVEVWSAEDNSGRVRHSSGTDTLYGPGELSYGLPGFRQLSGGSEEVLSMLETSDPASGAPIASQLFAKAAQLLGLGAPPEIRGSLYEILADIPAVSVEAGATDLRGRPAITLSIASAHTGALTRSEIFVNPGDGRLLGSRSVLLEPLPAASSMEVPFVTSAVSVVADTRVENTSQVPQ